MKALSKLILSHQPPSGVYWIGESVAAEELEKLAAQPATAVCRIQGAEIHTMSEFLEAARRAADAPEECGYNIEMFRDCMITFSSSKAMYITVYEFIEVLAHSNMTDFEMVMKASLYGTLARDVKVPNKRLYILLAGDKTVLESIKNTYSMYGKDEVNNFWHLLSLETLSDLGH